MTFPLDKNPPLAYRFLVQFIVGGTVPNPIDIYFQKVSGIGATVETKVVNSGGQNNFPQTLPQSVSYPNLVLERGLVLLSPLSKEFDLLISQFKFTLSHVVVILLDNTNVPIASWMFLKAFPVNWSLSPLDANDNSAVIETMELKYQRMQPVRP